MQYHGGCTAVHDNSFAVRKEQEMQKFANEYVLSNIQAGDPNNCMDQDWTIHINLPYAIYKSQACI
jgi:hypothetical protein